MTTTPPLLPPITAITPPRVSLKGTHVILRPLDASDTPALYSTLCGPTHAQIWRFLPDGPYLSLDPFTASIASKSASTDPLFFTAVSPTLGPIGHLTFMRITPAHATLEIGNIVFSDLVHRSALTTEAIFLMLRAAFEDWGYRRVEWKCDDRNGPSKAAAKRFGFGFEGLFRQHMVVKGLNRDTAWFSMLDCEWEGVKRGFERWLDPGNFDEEGRQRRRLEEWREG